MIRSLMSFLIFATIFAANSVAQDKKVEPVAPPTTRSIVGIKPSLEWDSEWPLPDPFNRVLYIHHADQSSAGREKTWVHRPLFSFVETEHAIEGYPAIVRRAEHNGDGSATLTFEALVTSEPLKQHLKRVLLNPDFTHTPPPLNATDIFLVQWPLEHCVIDCRIAPNGRLLGASADTGSLVNIKDRFRFSILFGPEDLREFLSRSPDGGIEFDFRYTFSNRRVAEAEDTARASREVELAVKSLFTDKQKSGEEPILQADYNRVQQWMRINVVRTIRAQRADLLPRFNESLFLTQIFGLPREVSFEQLKQDEKLRTAVAEHLKPLLDRYRTSTTDTKSDKNEKEHNETETIKIRAPEFEYGPMKIGSPGDIELKTEDKDKFTHETGVTLVRENESNRYVAQSIRVYRLNLGAESAVINSRDTAILGLDSLTDYYLESAVPTTFTEKAALGGLGVATRAPFYDGVPLGTMVPYFGGGSAPRGYVFADGQSNWPDEEWVHERLRGKPVPNMDGAFPYGTSRQSDVAAISTGTTVSFDLPGHSLPGLKISGGVKASYIDTKKTPPQPSSLHHVSAIPLGMLVDDPKYKHEPHIFFQGHNNPNDFSAFFEGWATFSDVSIPGTISYDGDGKLAGGKLVMNSSQVIPPYVMCRWIIRVK